MRIRLLSRTSARLSAARCVPTPSPLYCWQPCSCCCISGSGSRISGSRPAPWRLSLHDVLVVLAFYAVARLSVGSNFIACMLTIVGYSINATIVIFDRIRENLATAGRKADLAGAGKPQYYPDPVPKREYVRDHLYHRCGSVYPGRSVYP